MNDYITILLSLSLSGALLTCILMLFKPFYQDRLSRRWQYYIWLLVILRFLNPLMPETGAAGSFYNGVNYILAKADKSILKNEVTENGEQTAKETGQSNINGSYNTVEPAETVKIGSICFYIWIVTATGFIIYKIWAYQSFIRYIKNGSEQIDDSNILNILENRKKILRIKGRIKLYRHPFISSPVMTGFFHPRIVLPAGPINKDEVSYIFWHELVHYKYRDILYKWVTQITVCLHWFNPLVYLIGKEINRNCELACDEVIIKSLDKEDKKAYGDTLLTFLKLEKGRKNPFVSMTLSEGAGQVKERLRAIMKYRKKSKLVTALTYMLTLGISISSVAVSAYAAPQISSEGNMLQLDNGKTHFNYMQSGYYQEPYVIEMGYNLSLEAIHAYPDQASITLSDDTDITVCFDKSVKEYTKDKEFLEAIKELTDEVRYKRVGRKLILERPIITDIDYVPLENIEDYALECYVKNELNKFCAVFRALDDELQKDYCERIYEDGSIEFFSSVIGKMDDKTIISYAERAEEDGEITFFSILLHYLQPEKILEYTEKFYNEDNISQFSILVQYMTNESRMDWLERAEKDGKNTFALVLASYNKPL